MILRNLALQKIQEKIVNQSQSKHHRIFMFRPFTVSLLSGFLLRCYMESILDSGIPDQLGIDVKQHTEEFLWPVLISIALIAGGIQYSKSVRVSVMDKAIAFWYLWNGVWIHLFLDVGIGYFKRLPSLTASYALLDKRYDVLDPTVQTAIFVELFLQAPGCLFLCYGFFTQKRWRHPLQIFVCSLHLSTTIFYAMTEIVEGLPSIPVDWNLEFSFDHVLYFWICFVGATAIWICVPLFLAGYSMRVLSLQVAQLEEVTKQNHQLRSESLLVTESVLNTKEHKED